MNDMANVSQGLKIIVLCIHQYNIRILYKPGLHLFISAWLSRQSHDTNRDEEIPGGICIAINVIKLCTDIPEGMRTKEIRIATLDNEHLSLLSEYVLCSRQLTKLRYRMGCRHTCHSGMRLQSLMGSP